MYHKLILMVRSVSQNATNWAILACSISDCNLDQERAESIIFFFLQKKVTIEILCFLETRRKQKKVQPYACASFGDQGKYAEFLLKILLQFLLWKTSKIEC